MPLQPHSYVFLRAIRGVPITILFAMQVIDTPVTIPHLSRLTGYDHPEIDQALLLLESLRLVRLTPRGWVFPGFPQVSAPPATAGFSPN
jgi:hypothetical protein